MTPSEQPNSRTAEQPNAPWAAWIPLTVVAERPAEEIEISVEEGRALSGLPERTVRRRLKRGRHRYASNVSGGRRLIGVLASLPEKAQAKYRQGQGQGEGATERGTATGANGRAPSAEAGDPPNIRTPERPNNLDPWESARECDRQTAIARLAVLAAWRDYVSTAMRPEPGGIACERTRRTHEFIQHWRAAHPEALRISKSSLYRWDRLERERGRAGLLPGYAIGPRGQDIPPEILERFERVYLAPQRISIAVARRIVQGELALAGSPLAQAVPSTATFRRHVAGLPRATVVLAREGAEAFRRQFEPHVERDYTTIRVMQCWIADHAQFDFFCRDEGGRAIRPWLTLWQEMRSRRRVGWLVHGGPSQDTVLAALAMGILRYGIPDEAYTDNGRDFSVLTVAGSSRRWRLNLEEPRVRALTEHLGMLWHFALPKQPQGKGGIERAFGTDREHFDRLWGSYCGRNDQEKPEGLAALLKRPRDLPTLDQVQEAYTRYILEVADVLPHEGQGMDGRSPRAVFEAEDYVKRTATADTLRLLLMRCSRPMTVQRNGIWAFDRWYRSVELAACHGQEVYYRYDLDDLSIIHVFTLQDQFICSVARRDLVGATSRDHRKYVREKQAVRRIARAYLANLEKRASAPDALAAMAASARLENPGAPRPEDPAPEQRVVELMRTPLEAAAREMKRRAPSAESRERARAEDPDDELYREALARQQRAQAARPETDDAEEILDKVFKISERFGG